MTDDLISRMDAVQATRVGPSDEWSGTFKAGYEFAATEIMMNVLKIQPALAALPAADLSSPLGAVNATLDAAHEYLVAVYGHSPLAHPVDRARINAICTGAKP